MAASTHTRKTDKRVLRTHKAILTAYNKLICTPGVDTITVSAIAREAGIDRKTFYLHFKSFEDLAICRTEEAFERVIGVLASKGADKSRAERIHIALTEVNNILLENETLYLNIVQHVSTDQALIRFEQAVGPALMHSDISLDLMTNQKLHMRLQFFVAGAVSLYSTWLKSDRSQPIETVSDVIEEAMLVAHDI